jgi:NAD(P)-dependent dehydrogenase (short-subunit alcohol dehydrogenase family)
VRLFAKAVAMECAAAEDGIWVNTVHPGVIDTPIWTKLPLSAGRNVPIDPNEVAKAGVPFGRAGQAQDIANGVLFLASDTSSYMTDGGTGDRRCHDGCHETSMGAEASGLGSALSASGMREFC